MRFQIEDTRPGIAPEHFELIFEPFQQLNPPGSQIEGTGLGLTISRSLLERMGSHLYLDSKVDQGSRFWFELPAFHPTGDQPVEEEAELEEA